MQRRIKPPGDKLLPMHEAIRRYVQDGMSIAIEGFTAATCFAAGHEVIRQGRPAKRIMRP